MEKEFYTCEFCQTKFIPKRRKVQKFCSPSCRSKNHHHKNSKPNEKSSKQNNLISENHTQLLEEIKKLNAFINKKTKINQMSLAGVGNTLAGQAIYDFAKGYITSEEDKNVTQKDFQILIQNIQQITNSVNKRYFLIKNMERRYDGYLPYFDMETSSLIYLKDPNYFNPASLIS